MPSAQQENPNLLSLTLPQLDFWEEFSFHPDQPVSTVAHYLDIQGTVNEEALVRAVEKVIDETDVLALQFHLPEGSQRPLQSCSKTAKPVLKQIDLREKSDASGMSQQLMEEDICKQLDLLSDPLSALFLIRLEEQRYLLYLRAHHIIMDGYGFALFEQRCGALYDHYCGITPDAGLPFHSFVDFLEEEKDYESSSRWQKDREFWSDCVSSAGELTVLQKGSEDYDGEGLHFDMSLPANLCADLLQRADEMDMAWPDLLTILAGAYAGLARPGWSVRQDEGKDMKGQDTTVWLPLMSRWGSLGAHMPALMVNILPWTLHINDEHKLSDFIKAASSRLRQIRKHGRYRVEQLAADYGIGAGSRFFFSPLINVLPFSPPVFGGCEVKRYVLTSGPADGFNLTFRAGKSAPELQLDIDADPALMTGNEFEQHCSKLPQFLEHALSPAGINKRMQQLIDC